VTGGRGEVEVVEEMKGMKEAEESAARRGDRREILRTKNAL
jgi:hypothetical protein